MSRLGHTLNFVNIGYLSATHLVAVGALFAFVYAPEGLRPLMVGYLIVHLTLALISTTAYAHRLISHSATKRVSVMVHVIFGYLGQTLAAQGSLASWAGKHRVHHAAPLHVV